MTNYDEKIIVDPYIYSLSSIKKVCYKFSSQLSTILDKTSDGKIQININYLTEASIEKKKEIIDSFQNELIDQDLREIVANETEAVRNLILAHAFSKTSLVEPK